MKLQTVSLNNKGLTLVEVLISSVITLVLFMALMQAALLSVEVNAGNTLRNEAVSIAEERMREMRRIAGSNEFNLELVTDTNALPVDADCPAGFPANGEVFRRPFRNISEFDFCTNLTCVELDGDNDCTTSDGDMKQLNITLGWIWQGEDYIHRISTIVRRP